jgi:hypothetical protein
MTHCQEAFEQSEHCLSREKVDDTYVCETTAIHWLIWLTAWAATAINRGEEA